MFPHVSFPYRTLRLLVCLLLLPAAAHAGCLAPYWEPTVISDRDATGLVAADFDSDGKPDLAGVTATAVFVLRNDGTGRFAPAVDVHTATMQPTVVAGDFNGDTRTDLAFARDGALVILPGNGNGTFGTAIETATTVAATMLVAARMDGDASLDLVALDRAAAKLVVFRNNGAGAFSELHTAPLQSNGTSKASEIAVADLDDDARMDVVAGYDQGKLDVFYGRANGTLDAAVAGPAINHVTGIQAADMDDDGLLDLAVSFGLGIATVRNLGNRSFGAPVAYSPFRPTTIGDVAVAELTGDDRLDMVMASSCSIQSSTSSPGGRHEYQLGGPDVPGCLSGGLEGAVAAADFDGDGRIDAAASFRRGINSAVKTFRNRCGEGKLDVTTTARLISVGQSVSFTVQMLAPFTQNFWVPAHGDISVREGEQVLASATFSELGRTTLTAGGFTAGEHTLTLDWPGDTQYAPQQMPFIIRVTTETTTVSLTPSTPVGTYNVNTQVTARVTSSNGSIPTGEIRFTYDGNVVTPPVPPIAPEAKLLIGGLPGVHTLVAEYLGDASHPPSKATLSYVIEKQTPKIDLTPRSGPSGQQTAGFTLHISGVPSNQTQPKGNVTLHFGETTVGTYTLGSSGFLNLSFPPLEAGRYGLRVTYSGDAFFKAVDTVLPLVIFPADSLSIDARGASDGVTVSWYAPGTRILLRALPGQAWSGTGGGSSTPWLDVQPLPETVYLYRIQSDDGKSFSNIDVAMRFPFTDDDLTPERRVSPLHVAEVVRAANLLRAAAGLAPVTLPPVAATDGKRRSNANGSGVPSSHVLLLRTAINEARVKLGAYAFPFTVPVTANMALNAAQLQELRESVR
jgi:hypothetical protein